MAVLYLASLFFCLLYTSLFSISQNKILIPIIQRNGINSAANLQIEGFSKSGTGIKPVSYTHLDVYKRQAPFDIEEVRDITMYDELSLDTVGDKKTALFLIMSDTDPVSYTHLWPGNPEADGPQPAGSDQHRWQVRHRD